MYMLKLKLIKVKHRESKNTDMQVWRFLYSKGRFKYPKSQKMSVGEGKEGKGVVKFQEMFELNSFLMPHFWLLRRPKTRNKILWHLAGGKRQQFGVLMLKVI